MPVDLLEKIYESRPVGTALLGLDIGTKTIGLSVSNPEQTISTPLSTIRRRKFSVDIEELARAVRDYHVGGFVLGWPVNMDGSAGPRCDSVRSFADEMTRYPQIVGTKPWIALWDERLSTASVEEMVGKSVDISKAKQKGTIDALAAQQILQSALEFIQRR